MLNGTVLILTCFAAPILYMQAFSMLYGLRDAPFSDILTQSGNIWKDVTVNIILAAILTVKIAQAAETLTFLDHLWGLALFSMFAATYNTEKETYGETKLCYGQLHRLGDLLEQQDCQEVVIALYLYAHALLCLTLAVLQLFLMSLYYACTLCSKSCCARERRQDLQVLKLEASLALQYELYEKLEQEGFSDDLEGPLQEDIETSNLLFY